MRGVDCSSSLDCYVEKLYDDTSLNIEANIPKVQLDKKVELWVGQNSPSQLNTELYFKFTLDFIDPSTYLEFDLIKNFVRGGSFSLPLNKDGSLDTTKLLIKLKVNSFYHTPPANFAMMNTNEQYDSKSKQVLIVSNAFKAINQSELGSDQDIKLEISLVGLTCPSINDKYQIVLSLKFLDDEKQYSLFERLFFAVSLKEPSKKMVITTTDTSTTI